jgi:hypothetical protein
MGEKSGIRPASAFAAGHALRPLALDPANCEGLSSKFLLSHWENDHVAPANALNLVERHLDDAMRAVDWREVERRYVRVLAAQA